MKKIIFLYVILFISHTLKLPNHYNLIPALPQPGLNYPVHLDNTKNHQFVDQIHQILNESRFMLKTLQTKDVKKYSVLIGNIKQYNAGLQRLEEVLKRCKLFITQKQKICPHQLNFDKSQIHRQINYIQEREKQMLTQFNLHFELSLLTQNINKLKILSESYLSSVQKTIQGSFCLQQKASNLPNNSLQKENKKIIFKNNLDVSNWFYGSTNQLKYKTQLFKKALKFNLTACPKQQPFVRDNQQICFNCPPNSIYNLGNQKCDSCPPGKMFNVVKNICESCFGQMFIINHQFVCKACALEAQQLFNPKTGKCYTCKITEYLDTTAHACRPIKCPADQPKYNKQLQICQKCKPGQVINPKNPTECISKCSKEKPFFNNITNTCTECSLNQIYVSKTKSCQKVAKKTDNREKYLTNRVLSRIVNTSNNPVQQSSLPSTQHSVLNALIPPLASQPKILNKY